MLPRLEAEERLGAINDHALAAGLVPRSERRRMVDRLERAARGGRRQRAAKANAAGLAKIGIAVVSGPSDPPKEAGNDG